MWKTIYLFFCISVLLYTVFKKRKADFLSIYIVSAVIYYWPLFLGTVEKCDVIDGMRVFNQIEISDMTYLAALIWILAGFYWMLVSDISRVRLKAEYTAAFQTDRRSRIAFIVLCAAETGLIAVSIVHNHAFLFGSTFNKVALLNNQNMADEWAMRIAIFLFVSGFLIKGKGERIAKLCGCVFISYTLLMGSRSHLVLGLMAIGIIWLRQQKNVHSLWGFAKEKKKVFLMIVVFIPMVFLLKEILPSLIEGDLEGLKHVILSDSRRNDMLMHSEPAIITCNLSETLRNRLEVQSYRYVLLSFLPGIGTLSGGRIVPADFYEKFQETVYPRVTQFGMGGTFLGEAYANGWWIGLVIMANVICICILLMERYAYGKANFFLRVMFLTALPYFAFYIHRQTWANLASELQNMIYIGVLGYILCLMVPDRRLADGWRLQKDTG